MSKDTAVVLRVAAEMLETTGWMQGALANDRGERCAIGAIHKAGAELFWVTASSTGDRLASSRWGAAQCEAMDAVAERVPYGSIAEWNDDPDRRVEDVVKLFGQVADEEDVR